MRITPTPERRNVVLDIETVSINPIDTAGALSALNGRIVCIGLLFDDGNQVEATTIIEDNERLLLRQFWNRICAGDLFIGHNLLAFDMPFLRQRSWIQGVRPSRKIDLKRFYTRDLVDTMQLWSNWGSTKYPSLDALALALGCGQKKAEGIQVGEWWAAGDYASIAQYCLSDLFLSYKAFWRMMFRSIPERLLTTEATTSTIPSYDSDELFRPALKLKE